LQILKGNDLKSVTVNNLLKVTNSYCYVYNDYELPFYSYYVTTKATLEQLEGYLQEFIDNKNLEKHYDYFILYTNKTQEEIQVLIDWLKGKEADFNCRCILITCKL